MTVLTNIPPPRVDLLDQRTGRISREWYRFFLNLFTRSGGETYTSVKTTVVTANYTPTNEDKHLLCEGTLTITLQDPDERFDELIVTNTGTGTISFVGAINGDLDKKIAFQHTSLRLRPVPGSYKIV